MEETEYGFLRSIGLSVVLQDERGTLGFPRLSCRFEIFNTLYLDDLLKIELRVAENNGKQIRYEFKITNPPRSQALVATGSFLVACCRFPADAPPFAILVPHHVTEAIDQATSS